MKKTLVLFFIICLIFSISSQAGAQSSPNSNSVPSSDVQSLGVTHGAHIRPVTVDYGNVINTYNAASGKKIGVVMYFMDWMGVPNNPRSL